MCGASSEQPLTPGIRHRQGAGLVGSDTAPGRANFRADHQAPKRDRVKFFVFRPIRLRGSSG
ncbi:hypothetical protein F750_7038 [Streptomyces sp. PAMC 26508]|nr:hypothetical protein F750_7038 [Streptomyces sp. PAMC 26508]